MFVFVAVFDDAGYVMKVASFTGTMTGDRAIMTSKEYVFDEPSLLSFYVKMKVDISDRETMLNVHLMDPVGAVSETILHIGERGDNVWVKYYLCIPSGTYTLMFEAILGSTKRPVLALDAVEVIDGATLPSQAVYETILDYDSDDESTPSLGGPFMQFVDDREAIAAVYRCDLLNGE